MTTDLKTTTTELPILGPFDLREVALMGFGHRDEHSFDGVMRMAFCLDGDYERQVGVETRQFGDRLELQVHLLGDPPSDTEVQAVRKQVARVVSLNHDGEQFHELCLSDPVLARVHMRVPGCMRWLTPRKAAYSTRIDCVRCLLRRPGLSCSNCRVSARSTAR